MVHMDLPWDIMPSETNQRREGKYYDSTDRRCLGSVKSWRQMERDDQGQGRGEKGEKGELLFNGHRVSAWNDEQVLETDAGDRFHNSCECA